MICGPKSKTLWLLSALLLSVSLPLYSLPGWAADLTEAEAREALSECAQHLEAQINATETLESAIGYEQILRQKWQSYALSLESEIDQLSTQLTTRDQQLSQVAISFSAYEATARRTMIRNTVIGFGIGAAAGAIVYSLLPF